MPKERRKPRREKEEKGWQKKQKQKFCVFCKDNIAYVDYKDVTMLRKFVSERGKLRAPGDVVDVADGYAHNYLIPRRLAAPATKGGVRHSDQLKRAHEDRIRK